MKSMNKSNSSQIFKWLTTGHGMLWVIGFFSLLVFIVNIAFSCNQNGLGFPLDDAWIHQTYARGIAREGTWIYSQNEQSAGSTSPLWTLLLVPGFLFVEDHPFIWTYFVSWLCFLGLLIVSFRLFRLHEPEKRIESFIFSLIMIFEWHLVWASGSGMETLLFTLGATFILYLLRQDSRGFWIGFCIGLLVCVRPDGITLLGPALLILGINVLKKEKRIKSIFFLLVGLLLPLILYGYHNYSLSGTILPNTFFAKSAEYQELLAVPFFTRYLNLFTVLLSGAGIILLPGFLWSIVLSVKKGDLWGIGSILWILGFIFSYSIRLPVTYQHGRYLIPVIPMYLLVGYEGTIDIIGRIKQKKQAMYRRIILTSLVITNLIFLISGVFAFATDVKIINTLMVQPAVWLRDHTAQDSIVAAHDIGAIGYYSEREIIDLAGLIDFKVIPIIRDEAGLAKYIQQAGADYLVVFSDWYQELGKLGEPEIQYSYKKDGPAVIVQINRLFGPQ